MAIAPFDIYPGLAQITDLFHAFVIEFPKT